MDVNVSHPANAVASVNHTEDGMFIDLRFLQFLKAFSPIVVRFDVIVIVFKLIHTVNVPNLIGIKFDGMVMNVNDSHKENALPH